MTCESCTYFKKKTETEADNARSAQDARAGVCKRYPHDEIKDRDDYCGEWTV